MSSSRVGPHWHDERRKQLLAQHPEVRALVGHNPWTAALIVGMVTLQLSLAWAMSTAPYWAVVLLAYALGAFVAHGLGVLVHDAAHDLVFARPTANRWIAMLANVPLLFPAAMDFREKHLKHHAHLGEPDGADTQAPQAWDFRFVTNRLRTFIWHAMGPILTHSDAPAHRPSKWVFINIAVNVVTTSLMLFAFGFKGVLFLGVSGVLAFGHHPVGVRRYGEHLTLQEKQPTTSYYGPLNRISFDVGYHVEHHDLPSVPWNRLRTLHDTAPELYKPLAFVGSWTALLARLTFVKGEGPEKYFLERRPGEQAVAQPSDEAHHA